MRHRIPAVLGPLAAAVATLVAPLPGYADDPKEVSKDIIAVQIRKQGFACPNALKAERAVNTGDPDDGVWVLTCDVGTYKVRLIPKMAAEVKPLPNDQKSTQSP